MTQLRIVDSRKETEPAQQLGLTERLKTDRIVAALEKVKRFTGSYSSSTEPQNLSVIIVDGKIGEGTIKGTTVEVQMPHTQEANQQLEQSLGHVLKDIPEGEKPKKYQEILLALTSSTVLHEGTHGLIESKPGSRLASDFERASAIENPQGKITTLLDEGITYAVQGVFAGEAGPLGNLAPLAKESDGLAVKQRKILGEKLRSKVKEYLDSKKSIDEEFLIFAATSINKVLEIEKT